MRIFAGVPRGMGVNYYCQTTVGLSVYACVRQFEHEHSTHTYNLGPIYCCEYYKTQESRAVAGRTVRFAVNVDTYRPIEFYNKKAELSQRPIYGCPGKFRES